MWPLESNLTKDDVYWGMLLGLVEMIEGGVTTVADHYFFMDRDIILVDMNGSHCQPLHSITASLVYNTRAGDVQTVIVNGQVIMRYSEIKSERK